MQRYRKPDEYDTGYILNRRSWFEVVSPQDGLNLVYNPEVASMTGYSLVGSAALTHQTAYARNGVYAIKVEPTAVNAGVKYTLSTGTTTGQPYAFSLDLYGLGRYKLYVGDSGGAQNGAEIIVNGAQFWTRPALVFTATAAHATICIISLDAQDFYTGGFQLEQGARATTFISGNMQTPAQLRTGLDYGWAGAEHASMSWRGRSAVFGGAPIPLSDLGLEVTGFAQFGLASQSNEFVKMGLRRGSLYSHSESGDQVLVISGVIEADGGAAEMMRKRGRLIAALTGGESPARPVALRFRLYDEEAQCSEEVEIQAVYQDGLGGDMSSQFQEKLSVSMRVFPDGIRRPGRRGTRLSLSQSTAAAGIPSVRRNGRVRPISSGTDSPASATSWAMGADGRFYVADQYKLWRWDGHNWAMIDQMTSGGLIYAIVEGADGVIYYCGETLESAVLVRRMFSYDPVSGALGDCNNSTFIQTSSPFASTMLAHSDGLIVVAGKFSQVNWSTASSQLAGSLAAYDPSTGYWYSFGPEFIPDSNGVLDLAEDGSGNLWACGKFIHAGPATGVGIPNMDYMHVAIWSGFHWTSAGQFRYDGSAANALVRALVYDKEAQVMYVGGKFDSRYYYSSILMDAALWTDCSNNIIALDTRNIYPMYDGENIYLDDPYAPIGHYDNNTFPYITRATNLRDGVTANYGAGAAALFGIHDLVLDGSGGLYALGCINVAWNGPTDVITIRGAALYEGGSWRAAPVRAADQTYSGVTVQFIQRGIHPQNTVRGSVYWGDGGIRLDDVYGVHPLAINALIVKATAGVTGGYVAALTLSNGSLAWPTIVINGPCSLHRIVNQSSGKEIDFGQVWIGAREQIRISTEPGDARIISTTKGRIPILNSGSSYPDWPLVSGYNDIGVLMSAVGGGSYVDIMYDEILQSVDLAAL